MSFKMVRYLSICPKQVSKLVNVKDYLMFSLFTNFKHLKHKFCPQIVIPTCKNNKTNCWTDTSGCLCHIYRSEDKRALGVSILPKRVPNNTS